jgi:hypothetical protein
MIDMDRYVASIAYGKIIMETLAGDSLPPFSYSNTDEGLLQWFLDTFDIDRLYNDPLALDLQLTLNRWVVDGEPASEIRQQLINILVDHYGFYC